MQMIGNLFAPVQQYGWHVVGLLALGYFIKVRGKRMYRWIIGDFFILNTFRE